MLDFGLAKDEAGSIIWGYSKPFAPLEQTRRTGTDQRSDLYSAAATLYNLLRGKPPPDAETREYAIQAGEDDPLRPISELNLQIPPDLAAVLMQAMAIDKKDRPPTAAAMRSALHEATFLTELKQRQASPILRRTYSLFGYENDGGRESILWSDPMRFHDLVKERGDSFYKQYDAWIRGKRRFSFDEIVNGTWIKIGDHGWNFQVGFHPDGTLTEQHLISFDKEDPWGGSWKLIDGILRTNIGKYEVDFVASRDELHSGVEDRRDQRTAYFRVVQRYCRKVWIEDFPKEVVYLPFEQSNG